MEGMFRAAVEAAGAIADAAAEVPSTETAAEETVRLFRGRYNPRAAYARKAPGSSVGVPKDSARQYRPGSVQSIERTVNLPGFGPRLKAALVSAGLKPGGAVRAPFPVPIVPAEQAVGRLSGIVAEAAGISLPKAQDAVRRAFGL